MYIIKDQCDSAKTWQYAYQDQATHDVLRLVFDTSYLTLSFDLPNGLLDYMFLDFYAIIAMVLSCLILGSSYILRFRSSHTKRLSTFECWYDPYVIFLLSMVSILHFGGKKKKLPIPLLVWLRLQRLMKILDAVTARVESGKYSDADVARIKFLLEEILELHRIYGCLTPEAALRFRVSLESLYKYYRSK